LQLSLFERCPEVKVLFGFPADIDPRCEELVKSKRFALHATFLMEMMERTVEMLGDDNDQLTEALTDLGKKHVAFGVLPEYFPYMTEALLVMLKELLGDKCSDTDQKAFENVLAVLIADMVKGQRKVDKGLAAANKSVVIESWSRLTKLDNYEERAGILLFQKYVYGVLLRFVCPIIAYYNTPLIPFCDSASSRCALRPSFCLASLKTLTLGLRRFSRISAS
jgi:hemoglobin-like flavoprotein